jgi:hypothetical protein
MKSAIIVAAVVLGSLSPALAPSHYEFTWHDNVRPRGQPRNQAVSDAGSVSAAPIVELRV